MTRLVNYTGLRVSEIYVAVNTYIKDKVEKEDLTGFQIVTYAFNNYELTAEKLARAIKTGHPQVYARMRESLTKSEQGKLKEHLPDFTPVTRRNSDSFEFANSFAIDVDNDSTEPGKYKPWIDTVNSSFFRQFGFVAYQTASSTESRNRYRLVFRLPKTVTDPREYKQIVSAFIWRFGGDKARSDACGLFFGSSNFEPVVIGKTLSQDYIDNLVNKYNSSTEKKTVYGRNSTSYQNSDYSVQDIREMLTYIPPRPDYAMWIKVIGAVISAVGEEKAEELLKEWSPEEKDGEYYEKITRGSLQKSTVATLVYFAKQNGYGVRNYSVSTEKVETGDISEAQILTYFRQDEYGDAQLFAELAKSKYAFDHSTREWYIFDNHWRKDRTNYIKQVFVDTMTEIYLTLANSMRQKSDELLQEVRDLIEEKKTGNKNKAEQANALADLADSLESRAHKLFTSRRVNSCFEFVRSILGITGEEWDRDPLLLGVQNGVVELNSGDFRQAQPEEFIRTIAPTPWDGHNSPCERFMRFLGEVFGEDLQDAHAPVSDFVWRLFGYATSGLSREHIYPILWGADGRNGKTVLLEVLAHVLGGDVAKKVPDELIMKGKPRNQGAATPELYELMGARLVWVSETTKGRRIDATAVKSLSGGDTITCRPLYGQQVRFAPTHTLLLVTNYKPVAPDDDAAFWARVYLIPFNNRFVDNPDPCKKNEFPAQKNLMEVLKSERSGILAWLVRGFAEYIKVGLNPPESVKSATADYLAESDVVDEYLNQRCEIDLTKGDPNDEHDLYTTRMKSLHDDYRQYCKENKKLMLAIREFSRKIKQKFGESHCVTVRNRSMVTGVRIVEVVQTFKPKQGVLN